MKLKMKVLSSLMFVSLCGGVLSNSSMIYALKSVKGINTVVPRSLDELVEFDDLSGYVADDEGDCGSIINSFDDLYRNFEYKRQKVEEEYKKCESSMPGFGEEYCKMRGVGSFEEYRKSYLNKEFGDEWYLKEDKGDHGTKPYFDRIIARISATEGVDVSKLVSCLNGRDWVGAKANLELIVAEMRVKFGGCTRDIDGLEPVLYRNLFCYRVSKLGGLVLDYAINAYEHNDEEGAMGVIQYIIDNGYCDNNAQLSVYCNTIAGEGCGYKPALRTYLISKGFSRVFKGLCLNLSRRMLACAFVQMFGFFVAFNCDGLPIE